MRETHFHKSVFRLRKRNYSGTYVFTSGDFVSWSTEVYMDWNRVEGNWKQIKGSVKEKWGKLTDDDLNVINGRRDQLEGKIQQRYGLAKDQVRKDVDDWYGSHKWNWSHKSELTSRALAHPGQITANQDRPCRNGRGRGLGCRSVPTPDPILLQVSFLSQCTAAHWNIQNQLGLRALRTVVAVWTSNGGNQMSKKAAEHHKKASEHFTQAAHHHGEAAKHHEAGNHEKAAHHAHTFQLPTIPTSA
jgi:uncharacterized protein YjbJ (UPF0337 family)